MKKNRFSALIILLLSTAMIFGGELDNSFTINIGRSDIQWNPFIAFNSIDAQIFTATYEGLVTYHPATLKPTPGCAESWEISEDGLVYTFHLREDLKYSDGTPLISEHFANSWLKSISPEGGSPFASLFDMVVNVSEYREGLVTSDQIGIKIPDDRTIILELEFPAPQLLGILCHYSFGVAHPVLMDVDNWNNLVNIPVNGPYQIHQREPGKITLQKNSEYWDSENVEIDEIVLSYGDSTELVMNKFNRYETEWIISGMDSSRLAIGEAFTFSQAFSTSYYYFSNKEDVWRNPNVKKALVALLPWEKIREYFYIPAYSLVPPIPDYPEPEGLQDQNKKNALALLAEEGFPNGDGLPQITILLDEGQRNDPIPLLIKQSWENILNVEVVLEFVNSYYYYDALQLEDYTLGNISWAGDFPDPLSFLQMWESGSSLNYADYRNNDFDSILSESHLLTGEARLQRLSEAETELLQTGQIIPLQHFPSIHLIDLRFIDGWYPNALDIHPFKYLKWQSEYDFNGLI